MEDNQKALTSLFIKAIMMRIATKYEPEIEITVIETGTLLNNAKLSVLFIPNIYTKCKFGYKKTPI